MQSLLLYKNTRRWIFVPYVLAHHSVLLRRATGCHAFLSFVQRAAESGCGAGNALSLSPQCSWRAAIGFPSMAWRACRSSSSPQPAGRSTCPWPTLATTFLISPNTAAKRSWVHGWPRPLTTMKGLVWLEAPQCAPDFPPSLSVHMEAHTENHGEGSSIFLLSLWVGTFESWTWLMCFWACE